MKEGRKEGKKKGRKEDNKKVARTELLIHPYTFYCEPTYLEGELAAVLRRVDGGRVPPAVVRLHEPSRVTVEAAQSPAGEHRQVVPVRSLQVY